MLPELLARPDRKAAVVDATARLVEDEVARKSGLSGAALRAGFAAFKRVRPGIVRAGVERLLPELAAALDRHWIEGSAAGDVDGHFRAHQARIAADLLGVTDAIAARSTHRSLKTLYGSLRGAAEAHVREAVPRLPGVIRPHLDGAA